MDLAHCPMDIIFLNSIVFSKTKLRQESPPVGTAQGIPRTVTGVTTPPPPPVVDKLKI